MPLQCDDLIGPINKLNGGLIKSRLNYGLATVGTLVCEYGRVYYLSVSSIRAVS